MISVTDNFNNMSYNNPTFVGDDPTLNKPTQNIELNEKNTGSNGVERNQVGC